MRSAAAPNDERALLDHLRARRWFGGRTCEAASADVVETAVLPGTDPSVSIVLVRVGYTRGIHELYQLISRPTRFDALAEQQVAQELVSTIRRGETIAATGGAVEFRPVAGGVWPSGESGPVREIGAEQTNTSIVLGDEVILKVFRRIEPGLNPELELLHFLTGRGFPNVLPLLGWYAYAGQTLEATLGVAQVFAASAVDGWTLALDGLERSPDAFVDRLSRLGEVTGALHRTLGSERSDPGFRPEVIAPGSLDLLAETISGEIEEFLGGKQGSPLPGLAPPIEAGKAIRNHGDFHLGQVLWSNGDWLVVDFEGEPARPITERSEKHSPLRDVAGMLRSFAYAASAASILRGVEAPPEWEDRARAQFLAGYLSTVDPDLLPPGEAGIAHLLRLFELERALYELRYEQDNRPNWVTVAEAGIGRLLS